MSRVALYFTALIEIHGVAATVAAVAVLTALGVVKSIEFTCKKTCTFVPFLDLAVRTAV